MSKLKQLRTRCFFDITIAEDNIGRLIFELFNDVCPKTCENFKALCTGEKGIGKFTGKPLHYKSVLFHRVVKNFMIQSGDFSLGNGKGGESIYGGTFEDESFQFKHVEPFMLSMANRGKNTNGSQFFITLAPAPHLDGVHVVFGHLISGQDVIQKIANQAVDKNARPFVEIRISNCGELIPQIKSKGDKKEKKESKRSKSNDSSSDDSESDSDSDSSSGNDSSEDESDRENENDNDNEERGKAAEAEKNGKLAIPINDLPNAPKIYSNIKADEIPEVPSNRFLARNFKPKEDTENGKQQEGKGEERATLSRKSWIHSRSGRKVKGRGFLRYRTPSPDRDHDRGRFRRSETPPHWKSAQSKLKSFKDVVSSKSQDISKSADHKNGSSDKSRSRSSYDDRSRSSRFRRSRSRSHSRERYRSRRDSRSPDRSRDRNRRSRKRSRSQSSSDSNHEGRQRKDKANELVPPQKKDNGDLNARRPLEVRDTYEE